MKTLNSTDDIKVLQDAQYPLSNTIVLPLKNNLGFGFANHKQPQDLLQIEPRLPIKLSENLKVIVRPILPILSQFNTVNQSGNIFGLSDLNPQFYFASANPGKISAGIGPAFAIPTATNSQFGTGKVSAGPSVVFAIENSNWGLGFYGNNVWSFAGSRKRPSVNIFNLEAFMYYNFSNGWFLASTPNLSANWNLSGSDKWIVPVGGGAGRLFKVNDQYIIASIESFYNVLVPSSIGTKWSMRFSLYFVFPEKSAL